MQSLVELGWLFHKVQKYCESPKNESTCGLAARAFSAALQEELSMITLLDYSLKLFWFLFGLILENRLFKNPDSTLFSQIFRLIYSH